MQGTMLGLEPGATAWIVDFIMEHMIYGAIVGAMYPLVQSRVRAEEAPV